MNQTQKEIVRLKKQKRAMILAHFYQELEIQQVADVVGDSFELAKKAASAAAPMIVVCGVLFMAESAKILSPGKRVLLPRRDAGCLMADMIEPGDIIRLRAEHPDAAVMCYVNSSAAVKAESDICCTSSSAVRIARVLPQKEIIFVPDRNLGAFVASQVPEKTFYFHNGCCPVHHNITLETVKAVKARLPGALLLVHPECRPEVVAAAGFVGSTAQMIDRVKYGDERVFVVGTETGVVSYLREAMPDKIVYPLSMDMVCAHMKKTRLDDVLYALENETYEITLSDAEREGARASLQRMVDA